MSPAIESTIDASRVNDRLTTFPIERIPSEPSSSALPSTPCRKVRNIAEHNRGQVLGAAREPGQELPFEVVSVVWQWSTRVKEGRES